MVGTATRGKGKLTDLCPMKKSSGGQGSLNGMNRPHVEPIDGAGARRAGSLVQLGFVRRPDSRTSLYTLSYIADIGASIRPKLIRDCTPAAPNTRCFLVPK